MANYIQHITLQSGHSRNSYADEISPESLALCLRLIDECLSRDGKKIPIPHFDGYSLMAGNVGGGTLLGSVWHGAENTQPLINFAVATKSRNSAIAWRELHRFGSLPALTDADAPSPTPWIAVSIEPPLEMYPDAAGWLGDFERCLAWAWLKYRGRHGQ